MLQSTITVLFSIFLSTVKCSFAPAGLAAPVSISYRRIAPPSLLPFAASVSTFTKGLNIYASPYAAGVAPLPYYTRSLLPTSPVLPTGPVLPVPYGGFASGVIPQPVPGVLAAPNPAVAVPNGILPSPLLPPPFRVPQSYVPRVSGVPGVLGTPGVVPGVISPSSLLPAPFGLQGRSVHAVQPTVPIRPAVVG